MPKSRRTKRLVDRTVLFSRRLQLYWATFPLWKSLGFIWREYRSSTKTVRLRLPGYRAPIWLRAGTSDVRAFCHVIGRAGYEQDIEAPSVVIDAGAHIGLATVWYANRYPDTKIIALEPHEDNFSLLVKNCAAYENVIPVQAALWKTSGFVLLTDAQETWSYRVGEQGDAGPACSTVPAISVPDLLQTYELDRVSIFKIDIEGSEKEVFENSDAWIGNIDTIAIELHDRFKAGCSRAFYDATQAFADAPSRGEDTFVRRL